MFTLGKPFIYRVVHSLCIEETQVQRGREGIKGTMKRPGCGISTQLSFEIGGAGRERGIERQRTELEVFEKV